MPGTSLGPPTNFWPTNVGVLTTFSPSLIICYNVSQNSGIYFTYFYQFMTEAKVRNRPMGEVHRQGVEGGAHKASMPSSGRPPSQHLDIVTNMKFTSLTIACSEVWYGSISRSPLTSLPSLEVSRWGWRFLPSNPKLGLCGSWLHPEALEGPLP